MRDQRSDNKAYMKYMYMYSILTSKSRTPAPSLSHCGTTSKVSDLSHCVVLSTPNDVETAK